MAEMRDDDYLWDKSGQPDPEIAKLEASLGRLRHEPRRFVAPLPRARVVPMRAREAGAASIALLAGAAALLSRPPAASEPGVTVASLEGVAHVGRTAVSPETRPVSLSAGQEVVTGAGARVRLSLANGIGHVDMSPGTRLRLEEAHDTAQRLHLSEGAISAFVVAVPRLFMVDTASARAVDLGCAYTLTVDSAGNGRLTVTSGRVELEEGPRRSVVPAGASCETREGIGPGTPSWNDATPAFRNALARLDFESGSARAIDDLLRESRVRDALTLVHLLPRTAPADLPALYDRLAAIAPPPAGVTRMSVLSRQPWALDAWRNDILDDGDPGWGTFNPRQKLLPEKR
jgi:ferric-dicitrate binding protein FerR (iron transport regulator)